MSLFGVIVAGRLVQTDFERIDDAHFVINIPDADSVNHIVVFMTGAEPFPERIGGSVYFSWPNPCGPPTWLYLGHISNTKPSAIFRIGKQKHDDVSAHSFGMQQFSHVAQIGISVEQLSLIALQTPASTTSPSNVDSFTEFTTKMVENFYNYVASFATQLSPNSSNSYVPLNCLQQWYVTFQRRLEQNPTFWKS